MHAQELMDMIKDEPPLPASARFIASGPLNELMAEAARIDRQIERERKKVEHDSNLRCNYKFCRKRCKLYRKNSCYLKSYDEQRKCAESQAKVHQTGTK